MTLLGFVPFSEGVVKLCGQERVHSGLGMLWAKVNGHVFLLPASAMVPPVRLETRWQRFRLLAAPIVVAHLDVGRLDQVAQVCGCFFLNEALVLLSVHSGTLHIVFTFCGRQVNTRLKVFLTFFSLCLLHLVGREDPC